MALITSNCNSTLIRSLPLPVHRVSGVTKRGYERERLLRQTISTELS